ncbi:hypothetical protein N9A87_03950 [Euryarchaeota archaeon]|nr:hypothetical protein [Euryarchaeota archaeon]
MRTLAMLSRGSGTSSPFVRISGQRLGYVGVGQSRWDLGEFCLNLPFNQGD